MTHQVGLGRTGPRSGGAALGGDRAHPRPMARRRSAGSDVHTRERISGFARRTPPSVVARRGRDCGIPRRSSGSDAAPLAHRHRPAPRAAATARRGRTERRGDRERRPCRGTGAHDIYNHVARTHARLLRTFGVRRHELQGCGRGRQGDEPRGRRAMPPREHEGADRDRREPLRAPGRQASRPAGAGNAHSITYTKPSHRDPVRHRRGGRVVG